MVVMYITPIIICIFIIAAMRLTAKTIIDTDYKKKDEIKKRFKDFAELFNFKKRREINDSNKK